jgi:hypothetical protein
MKMYGGLEVYFHVFLTSTPYEGEWKASRLIHLTPREKAAGTHLIGGWVGPRAVWTM